MCGIVVIVGRPPSRAAQVAMAGAAQRGPHQHGWGFRYGDGDWRVLRRDGRLEPPPALTDCMIGHARLATSSRRPGDRPPLDEAQPFEAGRAIIAHNGTIPEGQVPDDVDVDSRLTLRAILDDRDPLEVLIVAGRPGVLVWSDGPTLWAARVDGDTIGAHPFWIRTGPGWLLGSSGRMPGADLLEPGVRRPLAALGEVVTPAE